MCMCACLFLCGVGAGRVLRVLSGTPDEKEKLGTPQLVVLSRVRASLKAIEVVQGRGELEENQRHLF